MKKYKEDIDKYYFWIKAKNILLLPSFIISLIVIVLFIWLTWMYYMNTPIIKDIHYILAFPLFLLAVWIVFTALLYEDIKVMKK